MSWTGDKTGGRQFLHILLT